MNKLFLFLISFFIFSYVSAQTNKDYYREIAGDSMLFSNPKLIMLDLEQPVKLDLTKGIYRMVVNRGINAQLDLDFKVIGKNTKSIKSTKKEKFIDFYLEKEDTISIIIKPLKPMEGKIEAKLIHLYSLTVAKNAFPFKLTSIDGKEYSKETLKGKVVVMNFWGISCKPCLEEIPQLNKVAAQFKDRNDVVFLAISSDGVNELNSFKQRTQFNYQFISDKNASNLSTNMLDLGVIAVPVHFIMDKKGNIIFQYIGQNNNIDQMLISKVNKQK